MLQQAFSQRTRHCLYRQRAGSMKAAQLATEHEAAITSQGPTSQSHGGTPTQTHGRTPTQAQEDDSERGDVGLQ